MNKGSLLIVDDEELILKNLERSLDDCASAIYKVENGAVALEVLKNHEPQQIALKILQ